MKNIVQQIPFLRPVFALITGIITATIIQIPISVLLPVLLAVLLALVFINRHFKFQFSHIFGFGVFFLFFLFGFTVFKLTNKKPVYYEKGIFTATVLEQPQQKTKSLKAVLKLTEVKADSSVFRTSEKLLAYFEKNSKAKKLKPGDKLVFSTPPKPVKNFGNPFEFDYKKYLERKKIYRTVYLSDKNWSYIQAISTNSLKTAAEQFRENLLKIYRAQKFTPNELEILSALTLGYKRSLAPETKRIFSSVGAMHVLAVSGLHVGIVLWVITLVFGFLRREKFGKIIFVVIAIGLLWAFAFITGLSPSVMRATTMFSIFIIGENISRKPNSYNSLAASAFFLLLINPNNLFDIGFQLSYSAVFGIIFLQPRLFKLLRIKNKIGRFFWTLITVSMAAQVTTFPITTFYFNQFPTYFIITNIIIIPAAMVLIPLAMALLVFSKITFAATVFSTAIQFIIRWSYLLLAQIEQFPLSVCKISVRPLELILIVVAIFNLFLFISSHRPGSLKATLLFVLLLLIASNALIATQNNKTEIIQFTRPHFFQLIKGRNNIIITENRKDNLSRMIQLTNNTCNWLKLKPPRIVSINDTVKNRYLFSENGIVIFEGKTILFDKNITNKKQKISPNYICNSTQAK